MVGCLRGEEAWQGSWVQRGEALTRRGLVSVDGCKVMEWQVTAWHTGEACTHWQAAVRWGLGAVVGVLAAGAPGHKGA